MSRLLGTLSLATAFFLSACDFDSDAASGSSSGLTGPIGGPVVQTVGASGGTVDATTLGVKVRVSFPAGALANDTAITITPQAPAPGDWVKLKLEPGGVVFTHPVTLVFEFPPGVVPGKSASLRQQLASSETYVATDVDTVARTLSVRLTTFGGAALDALAMPGATSSAQVRTLKVKALDDTAAPADATIAAQQTTPIADVIASVRRQVTIMENSGDFDAAFALQVGIASILNRRDEADYPLVGLPFLRESHDTACRALSAAIEASRSTNLKTASDFKKARVNLGNWWSVAGESDVESVGCPGALLDDFTQAGGELLAREKAFLATKFKGAETPIDFSDPAAEVQDARRNKLEVEALDAIVSTLDLPPLPEDAGRAHAVEVRPLALQIGTFAALIQTELLDPLVEPARQAAWSAAKEGGTTGQYLPLLDGFGPMPSLQQDAQYLMTRANITSRDNTDYQLDARKVGIDRITNAPVDPVRAVDVAMRRGTLQIEGRIAVLECPATGSENLSVTFAGVEIARVQSSNGRILDGALPTFTAADLLARANLPSDYSGKRTLLIRRTASACATRLGLTDDVLATVTLDFGAPDPPLRKFEFCYFVQGNVLPAAGQRVDTWEVQRKGDGTATLWFRNLGADFQPGIQFYETHGWPSESSTLVNARTVDFGIPYILNLAFTVDAQGKRHLAGTMAFDPLYDPGAGIYANINATCRDDLP